MEHFEEAWDVTFFCLGCVLLMFTLSRVVDSEVPSMLSRVDSEVHSMLSKVADSEVPSMLSKVVDSEVGLRSVWSLAVSVLEPLQSNNECDAIQ